MKVKELIEKLEQINDPELEVVVWVEEYNCGASFSGDRDLCDAEVKTRDDKDGESVCRII